MDLFIFFGYYIEYIFFFEGCNLFGIGIFDLGEAYLIVKCPGPGILKKI